MPKPNANLAQLIEDFRFCVGEEKLEYLIELAASLPQLPDWLRSNYQLMTAVEECMSPVHIFLEKSGDVVKIHFDIPQESPTVRGYAAVLQQGLDGLTVDQLQQIPDDIYLQLGLQQVLSGQRQNGIKALMARIKRLAGDL